MIGSLWKNQSFILQCSLQCIFFGGLYLSLYKTNKQSLTFEDKADDTKHKILSVYGSEIEKNEFQLTGFLLQFN